MKIFYCFTLLFIFQAQAQKSDFAHIDFKKADSLALVYKNERLTNIPQLTEKLTANLDTDVERFRALYKWVCINIANDYGLYARNMGKRHQFKNNPEKLTKWNQKFKHIAIQQLIKKHRTICTGYSYLLQQLAQQAQIPCEIVNGYARTSTIDVDKLTAPNHSWNAVYLNEKWYLCDPTWAAGIPNPATNYFMFKYNDGFFLAEPELMAINHYPEDPRWLLLENTTTNFNTFLKTPQLYGSAYSNLALYCSPEKMRYDIKKNEHFSYSLQLLDSVTVDKVTLAIDNGSSTFEVAPESFSVHRNTLHIDYIFKHRGFYDVHLYINDALISTHTVKVVN
ncbi:transglutaminase domain-containing protein [Neptunitalea lumnitzerae]|uniref:Transglutaminase-like domain-containing protein n=1 Tax=Neptunitalea lumnitzerae TaxID=2965509 RepID=A0ABQ5MH13_9FLAO|nr:transglutaminase domain-containing protein [Neptunitalea sp. Y10]GLB48711.1 hypothetical protein Y10_10790 [Neptunitalea sp. Y10]